jgi:hypothetical protein
LRVEATQVGAHIGKARAILDRGIARVLASRPDAATATRMLRAIVSDADSIANQGERAAEQAAMALETLYLASATRDSSPAARAAFDELFQQFQSPSSYDPRRFIAQVRKVEGAIGAAR